MALTTHEKIRIESGFQSRYTKEASLNSPDGIASVFFVQSNDAVKFVPALNTGNTIAGISDIQVWLGLSGIFGVSLLGISAINIDSGSIQLSIVPVLGSSLTINYSSSAISSQDVEDIRLEAEALINQRLSLCYNMPVASIGRLNLMAARLGAAFLLTRGYGAGTRSDMAVDGYKLYALLLGDGQMNQGDPKIKGAGEIGMICTPNWQMVDDSGNIVQRNDAGNGNATDSFIAGGRVNGTIYDITEEGFRKKDSQQWANQDQAGSGVYPNSTTISEWT